MITQILGITQRRRKSFMEQIRNKKVRLAGLFHLQNAEKFMQKPFLSTKLAIFQKAVSPVE